MRSCRAGRWEAFGGEGDEFRAECDVINKLRLQRRRQCYGLVGFFDTDAAYVRR